MKKSGQVNEKASHVHALDLKRSGSQFSKETIVLRLVLIASQFTSLDGPRGTAEGFEVTLPSSCILPSAGKKFIPLPPLPNSCTSR